MSVSVFLPCRAGSERVVNKNTREFFEGQSLLQIKLAQLEACQAVNSIVLSTNDDQVILQALKTDSSKLVIRERDDSLCSSETNLSDLIKYVPTLFDPDDLVLWTHVTSPMFNEDSYTRAIDQFKSNLSRCDSLMAVSLLKNFIFDIDGPVNFSGLNGSWPRTQDLPTWFEVTSACFIAPIKVYCNSNNRIGTSPHRYISTHLESVDIDTDSDFEYAKILYRDIYSRAQYV